MIVVLCLAFHLRVFNLKTFKFFNEMTSDLYSAFQPSKSSQNLGISCYQLLIHDSILVITFKVQTFCISHLGTKNYLSFINKIFVQTLLKM